MRLTKQTNYAVRMLAECARGGDALVRVADLAERTDLTLQHALKIAHALMRHGFLINQRGRTGGVRLAKPATAIRIGDVVRAMEQTGAGGDDAAMDPLIDSAFAAFIDVLDQHTLADFAAAPLKSRIKSSKTKSARPISKPPRAARTKATASPGMEVRRRPPA